MSSSITINGSLVGSDEIKYLTKGDEYIRPIERIRIEFLLDEQQIGIDRMKKSIEYFLRKGESND